MKIRFAKCLVVAFAMLIGRTAMAQDYYELEDTSVETVSAETPVEQASFLGGGCDDGCDSGGGIGDRIGGGGAYVDLELLYFQAGAGTYQNPEAPNACTDFELAPRISVG